MKGFDPDATVTTATVYQMLYNMEGKPAAGEGDKVVTTVEKAWYVDAVNWGANNGLFTEETFEDDSVIDRAGIKAIMDAYCALKEVPNENIMVGNENGDMMLDKDLTRAEFAQVVCNLMDAAN